MKEVLIVYPNNHTMKGFGFESLFKRVNTEVVTDATEAAEVPSTEVAVEATSTEVAEVPAMEQSDIESIQVSPEAEAQLAELTTLIEKLESNPEGTPEEIEVIKNLKLTVEGMHELKEVMTLPRERLNLENEVSVEKRDSILEKLSASIVAEVEEARIATINALKTAGIALPTTLLLGGITNFVLSQPAAAAHINNIGELMIITALAASAIAGFIYAKRSTTATNQFNSLRYTVRKNEEHLAAGGNNPLPESN